MSESYNSPNSPYWAMKAFFPLALESDHPFWQAEERPLPNLPERTVQPRAGKVICRDDHLVALSVPQDSVHGREKYTKFAYSTEFSFSVADRTPGPGRAGHDSSLALSLDGEQFKIPSSSTATQVDGSTLKSRWEPWDDVSVETWLTPASTGHVRVHRLETARTVHTEEGGFALDRMGDDDTSVFSHDTDETTALATYPNGVSGISDLFAERTPAVVSEEPNTNLAHPRTVVPTLRETYEPGEQWIASAVMASPDRTADWEPLPELAATEEDITIETHAGERILDCTAGKM